VVRLGTLRPGERHPIRQARVRGVDPNDDARIIGDIVLTLKPVEKLAFITDLNYGRDDGFDAEWYGVAQYGIVQLTRNSASSSVARFSVTTTDSPWRSSRTTTTSSTCRKACPRAAPSSRDSTYTALTIGLNIAPCQPTLLRPEVRWDWEGGGNGPFDDGTDSSQFTVAMDVIWKF